MGEGRDLRHVGDRDDLVSVAEEGHLAADRSGDFAADIGVDLVEDHQGDAVLVGESALHREHDARHFSARGDDAQGLHRLAGIGSEKEVDALESARARLGERLDRDFKAGAVEAEIL